MDANEYSFLGKFNLAGFHGARIIEIDGNEDEEKVKGVFIPLKENGLVVTKRNNVNFWFFMTRMTVPNFFGWTHFIKQRVNKNLLDRHRKQGFDSPFMGYSRPNYKFEKTFKSKKYNKVEIID